MFRRLRKLKAYTGLVASVIAVHLIALAIGLKFAVLNIFAPIAIGILAYREEVYVRLLRVITLYDITLGSIDREQPVKKARVNTFDPTPLDISLGEVDEVEVIESQMSNVHKDK